MIKTYFLEKDQKPTDDQLLQIKKASEKPIIYDEDAPALTHAMEKAFRLAAMNRNRHQSVS
jgi:hypothetical protein